MAIKKKLDRVKLDSCEIIFRNFSGTGGKFNPEGNRNFCVILSEEEGNALQTAGWNVKRRPPREDGEQLPPYLKVNIGKDSFEKGRTKIYRMDVDTQGKPRRDANGDIVKAVLDPQTVGGLDSAYIVDAQVILSPYFYDIQGRSGISAYVDEMTVVVQMDPWTAKYEDFNSENPDSAMNTTTFEVVGAKQFNGKLAGTDDPQF